MPRNPFLSPHAPHSRSWQRRRLALALCVAPLVIGSPLLLEGFRDPATILARWDMWLIFVALPFAAALLLARRGG